MAEVDPLDPTVAPPPIPPTPAPEPQAIPVAAPAPAPAQGGFYSYSPADQDITLPAPQQQAISTPTGPTGQPAKSISSVSPDPSVKIVDDSQEALPTTPGAPPHVTGSSARGNVIAEGDSVAYGLAKYNHLQGNPAGGRNPEAVFKNIESNLKKDPDYYRDSTVLLSPGIMNTNDKNRDAMLKFVPWQIQAIKNAGGDVLLTGVDKGSWKQFNPYLKQLADQTGATFGGELPTTDVHPSQDGYISYYGNNKLPYGGAPPQSGSPTERSGYQPAPLDRNVPGPYGATGYGLGHVAPKSERIAYIEQVAKAAGLNPYALLMTTATEGLHAYVGDQNDPAGKSYGDFQLNEGGMGRAARAAGINISDPATWKQQVDFVVQQMAAHRGDSRWFASQWHGPRDNAPWAVANFSNPDAQPPQGFSLAGGGQRFGGRTGVGRGGGFGAGIGAGGDGGYSLDQFSNRVASRDHVGFLTDVMATPTSGAFNGGLAKWMGISNVLVGQAIVDGHADQVPAIEDAITRMGWQGMNANLMHMDYALKRGDLEGAARYGQLAYSYFPDGAHVKFQTDGKGGLFAQRIGEGSGQLIGSPIPVTSQSIQAQTRFTADPQRYQEFLSKMQSATVKQDLDKANTNYKNGLLKSREQMNELNRQYDLARTIQTGQDAYRRQQLIQSNKQEPGLSDKDVNAQMETLGKELRDPVSGTIGGVPTSTPEGAKRLNSAPDIARSLLANGKGKVDIPRIRAALDNLATGEYRLKATNKPGIVALVQGQPPNEVPTGLELDEATAVRALGWKPLQQQAGPPPAVAAPRQAIQAGP